MKKILVLNGPNLNLLGAREPEVYGNTSYTELVASLTSIGIELGLDVDVRQSNSEGQLIDWLHEAFSARIPVVINPAAFTHYSYALRDAVAALTTSSIPVIEVHLSNPHAREEFRKTSVISAVATGTIAGFGLASYSLALRQLAS